MDQIRYYLAACLIFTLLSPPASNAEKQGSITLNTAVQDAFQNSPSLQKSRSFAEETSWKRVETYTGFLPNLSLSGQYLLDKKYLFLDLPFGGTPVSIPQVIPSSLWLLNATLPIFDGFSNVNHWLAAKAFESSAHEQADWSSFKLERDVTLAFYEALGSQVLHEVAVQNVKTLDDHLKDVTLFKNAGVSTRYDVLRVEVQMSEAQSELMNSTDNMQLMRDRLNEILGSDSDDRVLSGKLPELSPALINEITTPNRGDVHALEAKTEGFDYQEAAAGKYWVPKIALFGQYQYYNNKSDQFFEGKDYRNAYTLGLSFSWNLFDGMSSFARSKVSVEERFQAEKELQISKIKSKQDLEFWKRKYLYFCTLYRSRINDIQKSTESVRLARESRKAGIRTNSDLLDAELELFRARAGAVNAQLGTIESLMHVELASGKTLYRRDSL